MKRKITGLCIVAILSILAVTGCKDSDDSSAATDANSTLSTENVQTQQDPSMDWKTVTVAGEQYFLDENGNFHDTETKDFLDFSGVGAKEVVFDGKYLRTNQGDLLVRKDSAVDGTLKREDYDTLLKDVKSLMVLGESILLYTDDFNGHTNLYSLGKNPNGELGTGSVGDEVATPYLLLKQVGDFNILEEIKAYELKDGYFRAAAISEGEIYVWGREGFLKPTKYPWNKSGIVSFEILSDGIQVTDNDGVVTKIDADAMSLETFKKEDIVWDVTRGNSMGNIANGGNFTQSGNTVYFAMWGLAKYIPDDSKFEVLHKEEGNVSDVNVIGDQVTYINARNYWLSGDRVGYLSQYPNTSTRLSGGSVDRELNVFNDKIHWINRLSPYISSNSKNPDDQIYLTDLDGEAISAEDNQKAVWNVWMEDKTNTIFYTLNHGLYKSDFNGENPKRLADNVTSYQYADGWLYFNRYGTLVRLNSDTSAEEEVMSFSSFAFNVNGAYVYYTDGYSVYRYKIGTTDEPKMLNIEPYNEDKKFETIHVLPSGIYLNQQETGWAYRLTFDGHFINFMGLDHTEEQKN